MIPKIPSALFLLAAVALLARPTAAERTPADESRLVANLLAGKPRHIVVFGTSLSKSGAWVPQLQEALERRFPGMVTLTNGAKGGQNSRWGLENVEANVIARRPDLVFVEFSINDSVARFDLSLEESRKNLEAIIERIAKALPQCEIVLQIMNPAVGKKPGDTSYRRDQDKYQQIYRDVARERGLLLVDHSVAWKTLLAEKGESGFLELVRDGVHPSPEGYSRYVTPTLIKALGVPASTRPASTN